MPASQFPDPALAMMGLAALGAGTGQLQGAALPVVAVVQSDPTFRPTAREAEGVRIVSQRFAVTPAGTSQATPVAVLHFLPDPAVRAQRRDIPGAVTCPQLLSVARGGCGPMRPGALTRVPVVVSPLTVLTADDP